MRRLLRPRRRTEVALGITLVATAAVVAFALAGPWSSDGGDPDRSPVASGSPAAERDPVSGTTVPAGDGRGSIHETVGSGPAAVTEQFAMGDTADFGNGVTARLASVAPVEAEGHLPGEFSGPAVALTIEVANGSTASIDLGTVTADLTFGDGLSAYPVRDPAHRPFSGDLGPGGVASGSYVFTLDPGERDHVALRLSYTTEAPTVVFAGSVADG
ncbi:MAG TPA: hypothetical protein VH479_04820 [Acidimicrobiales bacterium]|jgi:hypothetical protein